MNKYAIVILAAVVAAVVTVIVLKLLNMENPAIIGGGVAGGVAGAVAGSVAAKSRRAPGQG